MPKETATAQARKDFLDEFKNQEETAIKTKDFLKNYDLWNKKDKQEIKELDKLLVSFAY